MRLCVTPEHLKTAMTFINELVPEEEKERLATQSGFSFKYAPLWKWTIDRNLDARLFLVNRSGGAYDGTPEVHHLALELGRDLVTFSAEEVRSENVGGCATKTLKIRNYRNSTPKANDEIKEILKAALRVRGFLYREYESLEVDFGWLDGYKFKDA